MPTTLLTTKTGEPVKTVRVHDDLLETARCLILNGYIEILFPGGATIRIYTPNVRSLEEEV